MKIVPPENDVRKPWRTARAAFVLRARRGLNEQFPSTFIPSGAARAFSRGGMLPGRVIPGAYLRANNKGGIPRVLFELTALRFIVIATPFVFEIAGSPSE